MVREGYLWNSGIFVWRVGDFLAEVRKHCPGGRAGARRASDTTSPRSFGAVRSRSPWTSACWSAATGCGHSGRLRLGRCRDVGRAARVRPRGRRRQRRASGAVHAVERRSGNVVHAEGNEVVLYGVSDLVVVTHDGLTLVTTTEHAADLKQLLAALPARVRDRE